MLLREALPRDNALQNTSLREALPRDNTKNMSLRENR